MMRPWFRLAGIAAVVAALGAIAIGSGSAAAAPESSHTAAPDISHACPAPLPGFSSCGAIQLLNPAKNWHGVTHAGLAGPSLTNTSPIGGFYPGDLQNAYGVWNTIKGEAQSFSSTTSSASLPTIAVIDAYDDPNAYADLSVYRSIGSTADPATTNGTSSLPGAGMAPLCAQGTTIGTGTGCVTFNKFDQNGGTSYPRANKGWAEEISLDLDMASAMCPYCNIALVEASSASNSNLKQAVATAKAGLGPNGGKIYPVVVTNSYGSSEFSGQSTYDSTYASAQTGSKGSPVAVTASSGDSGYGVEYPASDPYLTAVGGTSLTYNYDSTTGNGTWSRSVWSGAGAGCSAYEPQQSWQNVFNADCPSNRIVSDISAVADPNTGVAVYDTYGSVYGMTGWLVFGGTSASAQIIGGIYGLSAFSGSEQASPSALYANASGNIVPVTTGNDGNCGNYLCQASSGNLYNGPTGLGTPFGLAAFTTAPSTSTSSPSFSISATQSPTGTVTAGTAVTYDLTVTPSGSVTGTVALTVSNCPTGWTCTQSSVTFPGTSGESSQSTTLTVTPPSGFSGNQLLTISGSDASYSPALTSSTNVTLDVTSSGTSGGGTTYTVNISGITVVQNGKGPYHVTIPVTSNDTGATVDLGIYALSSGATCSTSIGGTPSASGSGTVSSNGTLSFSYTTKSTGSWCAVANLMDSSGTTSIASASSSFTTP